MAAPEWLPTLPWNPDRLCTRLFQRLDAQHDGFDFLGNFPLTEDIAPSYKVGGGSLQPAHRRVHMLHAPLIFRHQGAIEQLMQGREQVLLGQPGDKSLRRQVEQRRMGEANTLKSRLLKRAQNRNLHALFRHIVMQYRKAQWSSGAIRPAQSGETFHQTYEHGIDFLDDAGSTQGSDNPGVARQSRREFSADRDHGSIGGRSGVGLQSAQQRFVEVAAKTALAADEEVGVARFPIDRK